MLGYIENIEYRLDIDISNVVVLAASVLIISICREAQVLFLMVDLIFVR